MPSVSTFRTQRLTRTQRSSVGQRSAVVGEEEDDKKTSQKDSGLTKHFVEVDEIKKERKNQRKQNEYTHEWETGNLESRRFANQM